MVAGKMRLGERFSKAMPKTFAIISCSKYSILESSGHLCASLRNRDFFRTREAANLLSHYQNSGGISFKTLWVKYDNSLVFSGTLVHLPILSDLFPPPLRFAQDVHDEKAVGTLFSHGCLLGARFILPHAQRLRHYAPDAPRLLRHGAGSTFPQFFQGCFRHDDAHQAHFSWLGDQHHSGVPEVPR